MVNDYNVMIFQECPKCKDHEPDYAFTNCSFDVERGSDGKAIQLFESRPYYLLVFEHSRYHLNDLVHSM